MDSSIISLDQVKFDEPVSGFMPLSAVQFDEPLSKKITDYGLGYAHTARAMAETGAGIVTGLIAFPVSRLRGLWELALTRGDAKAAKAAEDAWAEAIQFQPTTEEARGAVHAVMIPIEPIFGIAREMGELPGESWKSPAMRYAGGVAAEVGLPLKAGKMVKGGIRRIRETIKEPRSGEIPKETKVVPLEKVKFDEPIPAKGDVVPLESVKFDEAPVTAPKPPEPPPGQPGATVGERRVAERPQGAPAWSVEQRLALDLERHGPRIVQPGATSGGKQPWEMTRGEYAEYHDKFGDPLARRKGELLSDHEFTVKQALSEGRPVPPSVLKDYPELGAKPVAKGRAKGAENAVTYLERQGGVNWGPSYNYREMRQDVDAARISRKAGMAPDEAADILNGEGFKHPDGGMWDADRLAEIAKTGRLRKVFTPEKQDAMIDRQIRKMEAEYYAGIEADLKAEGIEAGRIGENSESIKARLAEEIKREGDIASEEAAAAELESFFNSVSKKPKFSEETAEIPGASARETFDLVNPETEMGVLKPKDKGPKTTTLFDEKGSFSLRFRDDKTDILNSSLPAGSEAAKVNTMYEKTRAAIADKNALTYDKLKNTMVRAVVDVSGNLKRAVVKADPTLGREVMMNRELLAGSSAKAAQNLDGYRKTIFDGLRGDEQEILNRVIQSRRTLDIEAYKPDVKHPGNLSGTSHAEYLAEIEQVFGREFASNIKTRADAYFKATRDQLDQLRAAGILSDESYNALQGHEYSPRQFLQHLDPERTSVSGGRKITVPDSGIKALDEGSYELLENNAQRLLDEVVVRTQSRIFRNEANKSLYKLAENVPDNGVVKKAQIIGTTKAGAPKFQSAGAGNETVTVMIDGQPREMIMPSQMAREWVQNDPLINQTAAEILQWLSGSKVLKAGATGYNPAFAATNVPRDIGLVWASTTQYSKNLPVAAGQLARDFVTVLPDVITRKGRVVDYINEGGGMQLMTYYGRFSGKGQMGEAINSIGEVAGWIGETSEIWTRMALRERGIRNGLSPKEATWQARRYLDFSQGGNVVKALDNGLPYLNASVQGTRSIFRGAKENPGVFTYKMAQLGALASSLYLANYQTNPECWKQVSDREKEANFIITTPFKYNDSQGTERHLYFKVAKDYGQRTVTSLFEGMMAKHHEGKFPTDQMFMAASDLVSMTWMPPTMSAAIAYLGNKDTWTWGDIWRGPKVEPGAEYTADTNRALVGATSPLGLSPERTAGAVNKILPLGNPFVALVGGAFKAITGQLGEDIERKTMAEILTTNPSIRRVASSTNPYTADRGKIEEEKTAETTRRFSQTRVLDDLAKKYYQSNDSRIGEKIIKLIEAQPPGDHDRLVNRVENIEKFSNIPDRTWWLNVSDLPAEVRAKVFYEKYSKAKPEKQEEMLDLAESMGGFVSDEFILKLEELVK